MHVILLEKIRNLGNLGDKVDVRPGYGRNYLVPQKKAVFATKKNIEHFEAQRSELEEKARQSLAAAEQRAAKIRDITLSISAQASEEGKLYGSIGIHEILQALKDREFDVSKRELDMPEGAIHYTGEYVLHVHLHSDVIADLQVKIIAG